MNPSFIFLLFPRTSIYLSIYLSIYQNMFKSIYVVYWYSSIGMSIVLVLSFFHLSKFTNSFQSLHIYLSIYFILLMSKSMYLSIYLSIYFILLMSKYIYLSIYQSILVPIYQSFQIYLKPFVWIYLGLFIST